MIESLNGMDGTGTITWDEFLENAENFVVLSNAIGDSWEIRGEKVLICPPAGIDKIEWIKCDTYTGQFYYDNFFF